MGEEVDARGGAAAAVDLLARTAVGRRPLREILPVESLDWIALGLLPPSCRRLVTRQQEPLTSLEAVVRAHGHALASLVRDGRTRARAALERARELDIEIVPFDAAGYPPGLRQIDDPPPALWIRGDKAALLAPSVAIVGSRAASPHAVVAAQTLGRELAQSGVTVVSGLARGVDSAAHRGAVETGSTVAVFGAGVDWVYPREHRALLERLLERGAAVSEFLPGTPPRAAHFPQRNRVIAGLSAAVVVVEASENSGSLITAHHALEQGREVMVVPANGMSGRNRGGHALLRDGALLVESARDVLDELRWPARAASPDASETPRPGAADAPILEAMAFGEPYDLEELAESTGEMPKRILAALLALELDGFVARVGGGRFVRLRRK